MKLKTRNALSGYLLALPFLIGFAGFYLIPFFWSIRFTFTSGSGGTAFVGLRNYMDIFGSAAFRLAAWNTFRFILIGVPLLMLVSLVLALLLFDKFRGASFFRSLFMYPLVLPAASVVIVVQAFFSNDGLLNQFLSWLGLPIEDWIQSEYAFPLLIALYIWKNCGYDLVLFLAGLSAIPREYREAAASEGASYWQTLRYITLPLMPYQVTLVSNYFVIRELGLMGSWASLIIPSIFSPFGVFLLRQVFDTCPDDLLDAARIDGAGNLTILFRILLPRSRAGVVSLVILTFVDAWNMVEQPLVYLDSSYDYPLSVFLSQMNGQDVGVLCVCGILAALPVLLLFLYYDQDLADGISLSQIH